VAHVKWLSGIEAISRPYVGRFNTELYVYQKPGQETGGTPVTTVPVKAVLARPKPGSTVPAGRLALAGFAWSGLGKISRVEVSTDGGRGWRPAELGERRSRWAWVAWSLPWEATPGEHELCARATDESGATQPLEQPWNVGGMANNMVQRVPVTVR
jgi:hypothetical protein